MKRFTLPLVGLMLVLSACAPSVVGSRNNPIDLRRDTTIVVTPGETLYLAKSYPTGAFGLPPGAFASRLSIPLGSSGSLARVGSEFDVVDLVAPEGYRITLDDVWAEARADRAPSIEVRLRLEVPAGARPGGNLIKANVRARATGGREPIEVIVQILQQRAP